MKKIVNSCLLKIMKIPTQKGEHPPNIQSCPSNEKREYANET